MEVWKDNILDEIEKGISEVETMEELFEKMREEFGEFDEESRKADELRLLVQGPRMSYQLIPVTGIKPTVSVVSD